MASKKDNLPQAVENDMEQGNTITSVSYTHLTLPTN